MGRREAFDPLRSYVVNRAFSWGGKVQAAGEPFTDRRDMRRLRQLYDGRYIRISEVDAGAPVFSKMPDEQLRNWLTERGLANLAHPRSTRARLIDRCQRAWLAEKEKESAGDGVAPGQLHSQDGSQRIQGSPPVGSDQAARVRQRERLG